MSIFSNLRKSRQQAKEHKAKAAEQKKLDAQNAVPYKHVPTHAASDAIASAPPAWREAADRPRIVEQNRRRSAMAAAGFSMNMPSSTTLAALPRAPSSLSHVSYPSGEATPHVRVPRTYSYNSIHPYGGNREVIYPMPEASASRPSSWKGKDVSRNSFSVYDVSGGSSTIPSKEPTPEGSSRASNSSHDELEIVTAAPPRVKSSQTLQVPQNMPQQAQQLQSYHQVQHIQQAQQLQNIQQAQQAQAQPQVQQTAQPQATAAPIAQQVQPMQSSEDTTPSQSSPAHRLHPSHRRTSSEISDKTPTPTPTKSGSGSRPPTSMRGFNYIQSSAAQPTVAAPLPGKLPQPDSRKVSPQYNGMGYGGFAPKTPSMPAVAPPAARSSSDLNLNNFSVPSPGLSMSGGSIKKSSAGQSQYQQPVKEHYASQRDMEPIVSAVEPKYARHSRAEMPPPVSHDALANMFPEPAPDAYDSSNSGRGKLNKSKKTRWSFSKSSAIAA